MDQYDALIIGGGPSGSSAGAILAESGHRVLILEREKFPRYHIGESLIPFTYHPLERLGMIPKMKASRFVKKYSVRFVQPDGHSSQPFYFYTRYDKDTVAQTWQVLRSEFDQMLLDNAREKGAEVREQTKVVDLLRDANGRILGVRVEQADGTTRDFYAKITLDCTGKEAFSMLRQGWKVRDPFLNKVAVWTYYKGTRRAPGIDEGQTVVAYVQEKGWFWHIPLHDDLVSVGVVAEGKYLTRGGLKKPEEIFQREVQENQWIKECLATGQQVGEYRITSEYTHHARYCASPGLLLVGDAFVFLDPVFSSGVLLALKSGVLAGEETSKALRDNDLSPARFAHYGQVIRQGVENMRKLVYAFYHPDFSFSQLTRKYPEVAGAVTDCLSGDVNKDYSALWEKVRELVPLPEELPIGEPLCETSMEKKLSSV